MQKIVSILLILSAVNSYSQNLFRFIGKGRRLKVERRIVTRVQYHALARRVLNSQTLTVTRHVAIMPPSRLVGPTNYLRGVSTRLKGRPGWERIGQSGGYNGAHHIVTRAVIKQISGKSGEILSNAPAVFHPLHNNPNFEYMFHDHKRQLQIYENSGVEGVIIDFFDRANAVSKRLGLPLYNDEVIKQALLEGELWAKHWGLKWN